MTKQQEKALNALYEQIKWEYDWELPLETLLEQDFISLTDTSNGKEIWWFYDYTQDVPSKFPRREMAIEVESLRFLSKEELKELA